MTVDVDHFTELASRRFKRPYRPPRRRAGNVSRRRPELAPCGTGYFPADKFPSGEPQRIPYFLKWCDFHCGPFGI